MTLVFLHDWRLAYAQYRFTVPHSISVRMCTQCFGIKLQEVGFLLKLFLGRGLLPCIFDIYVNMLCYGKSKRLKCRIGEILSS